MRFEWDPEKAKQNEAKHGISFTIAITAFDDPNAWIALDSKHSSPEEAREWLLGESDCGILVVVFTRRLEGTVYRIISARRANRREEKSYEQYKGFSF